MGRIRTIKPEFPQSESMGRVSRDARLLFILLWTLVDDEGRTRGSSRMVASLLFPYDKKAGDLIDGWFQELEKEKCIIRYEVEGNTYIQVEKWKNHQKIDHPSKSRIPSPEFANPREPSGEDQGPRTEDQGKELGLDLVPLVDRVFDYYCKAVGKDSKRYTLTGERRKKAELRIEERLKIHQNAIDPVRSELKAVVDNLAASDYHRTGGYLDWNDQIFRSTEEFEKRLNWQKPQEKANGGFQTKADREQSEYERVLKEIADSESSEDVRFASAVDAGRGGAEAVHLRLGDVPDPAHRNGAEPHRQPPDGPVRQAYAASPEHHR